MRILVITTTLIGSLFFIGGCKSSSKSGETSPATPAATTGAEGETVKVSLAPKSGSSLAGQASFTEAGDGVKVVVEVSGLTPGQHGVHIHEKPDCSAPDASSAGSHYNPDNNPHALPDGEARHLGDLGNIEVGTDGSGKLEATAPKANLKAADVHSFRDRAIIVHEKPDDGGQPTGNAGGRVGCAEIR